ncbi:zf-DHHC-domain-containing protein [Polychaeton citri CBS 116435]|uniref:Palmitoyltransferase n=1 Tax=Polychaeton citri CBS 116435 TaxID=1314669 RepID=A0A9P4Q1N0_9PEZI|nr:zf-DHHC-domain-containing protein [Polychaeton citri CBS 116435]
MAPSTSFDAMPSLASTSSPTRSPPFHRRRKSWARRIERCCFWVEINIAFLGTEATGGAGWWEYFEAALGLTLYALADVSYTIAVFTDPGSPLNGYNTGITGRRRVGGYEGVSQHGDEEESMPFQTPAPPAGMSTVTAKSDGKPRFCKKCRCLKPDRTHHCSTCRRCVLKMDHHCPWLATCVGLRNYKAFVLFLVYVSLFCWLCLGVSAPWVWTEIVEDKHVSQGFQIVNIIMLAVLGGIIGLVLSGFTGWHLYLVVTGQTTIESLEKTRYLSPLKQSLDGSNLAERHYLHDPGQQSGDATITDQLKEIHANALPGVLRPEEGESGTSTPLPQPPHSATGTQQDVQRSYASMEEARDRQRYEAYLDEVDSEKMPNAFDMGWKGNVFHLFGPSILLWPLPICNTTGDGWHWKVSEKWVEAKKSLGREREIRRKQEEVWDQRGPNIHRAFEPPAGRPARPQQTPDWRWTPGKGFINQIPGSTTNAITTESPGRSMPMQPLERPSGYSPPPHRHSSSSSSDVDEYNRAAPGLGQMGSTRDWNDIPEDFLAARQTNGHSGGDSRGRSRARRKGD